MGKLKVGLETNSTFWIRIRIARFANSGVDSEFGFVYKNFSQTKQIPQKKFISGRIFGILRVNFGIRDLFFWFSIGKMIIEIFFSEYSGEFEKFFVSGLEKFLNFHPKNYNFYMQRIPEFRVGFGIRPSKNTSPDPNGHIKPT